MSLPSKYAPAGLSSEAQKKTITVGKPRANRPVGVVKLEERVQHAVTLEKDQFPRTKRVPDNESSENVTSNLQKTEIIHDDDGDIPMIGMDDDFEVKTITNYVTNRRTTGDLSDDPMEIVSDLIENRHDFATLSQSNEYSFFIVDTNFILSHLNILENLRKISELHRHKIIIPITTIQELDGLKKSNKLSIEGDSLSGQSVGHLARWANDWIYQHLAENESSVRGQKLKERIDVNAIKDDAILDCCLYFQLRVTGLVVLLSNDKNLCMKALTNDILTVSYRKGMSAKLIAEKVHEENLSRIEGDSRQSIEKPQVHNQMASHSSSLEQHHDKYQNDPSNNNSSRFVAIKTLDNACETVYNEIQRVVLSAIDYCMFKEYGDDLDLIGYNQNEVSTLKQSSQAFSRFWISVFDSYFKDHRHKNLFKDQRGKKNPIYVDIPRSEVELLEFVTYWSDVLSILYVGRDSNNIEALEKLVERWQGIAQSFLLS